MLSRHFARDLHLVAHPVGTAISLPVLTLDAYAHSSGEVMVLMTVMHGLAMLSCSISPTGHRSFIEFIGVHNRLDWTSIRKPRHHHDNQFGWLAKPFQHGAPSLSIRYVYSDTNDTVA